jgi:hypothetical protein
MISMDYSALPSNIIPFHLVLIQRPEAASKEAKSTCDKESIE